MAILKQCLIFIVMCNVVNSFNNPCPKYFKFERTYSGTHGKIFIPIPRDFRKNIFVEVKFDAGKDITTQKSKLEPITKNYTVLADNICKKQPIEYRLTFPPLEDAPVHIKAITVNNQLICSGSPLTGNYPITSAGVSYSLSVVLSDGRELDCVTHQTPAPIPVWSQEARRYPTYPPTKVVFSYTPPTLIETNVDENYSYQKDTTSVTNSGNTCACGYPRAVGLIVNGERATKADYPWLGALFHASLTKTKYICGANLITSKHAITAGHCVDPNLPKTDKLYIILGREDLNHWLGKGEQIEISSSLIHKEYKRQISDGDVALLFFSRAVECTPEIKPVCLWRDNNDIEDLIAELGDVAGWGYTERNEISNVPIMSRLPIVNQKACNESHPTFSTIISDKTFCAGRQNGVGPSRGDSGSGFYMFRNSRWFLRGVVSKAIPDQNNNADLNHFVVFADVAKCIQWIFDQVTAIERQYMLN